MMSGPMIEHDVRQGKSDAPARTMPWTGAAGLAIGGSVAAVLRRYLPFDWSLSVYVTITGLAMAVWGGGLAHRWSIALLHLALLVGVFSLVAWLADSKSRAGRFVRFLYVPMTITFFYEETAWFLHLFHRGWFDRQLIALEETVCGILPNLWLQPWQKPLMNDWMMFGYFSYYLFVALPPLILYLQRREREAVRVIWGQSLAFFISYIGFMLYPVQGPRFELAGQFAEPLRGFVFVPLVNVIMDTASIHGGCMPSSHVAVALVCLVFMLRYQRRWGILCTPVVITLWLATVYGRFHYLSDVFLGLFVGGVAAWIAWCYPTDEWLARALPEKAAMSLAGRRKIRR